MATCFCSVFITRQVAGAARYGFYLPCCTMIHDMQSRCLISSSVEVSTTLEKRAENVILVHDK
jgi:hypothetical protein